MSALTFGVIEAGADGFGAPEVLVALAVAVAALAAFIGVQHPSASPTWPASRPPVPPAPDITLSTARPMPDCHGCGILHTLLCRVSQPCNPARANGEFINPSCANKRDNSLLFADRILLSAGIRLQQAQSNRTAFIVNHGDKSALGPDVLTGLARLRRGTPKSRAWPTIPSYRDLDSAYISGRVSPRPPT
jgi:hypothetical protein